MNNIAAPDSTLLALAAFAFVSSITPGPNNLMLMSSGIRFGLARTVPHVLGVSLGFVAMVVGVGAGLAQVFVAWPPAQTVLKVVSVTYLLYLAWKIATAVPTLNTVPDDVANRSSGRPMSFIQAALFQWVNPKAWTMALTAVTVYTPSSGGAAALLQVAVVFGLVNLPSVGAWALLGVSMRRLLSAPQQLRRFNFIAALLLVASLYPVLVSG